MPYVGGANAPFDRKQTYLLKFYYVRSKYYGF